MRISAQHQQLLASAILSEFTCNACFVYACQALPAPALYSKIWSFPGDSVVRLLSFRGADPEVAEFVILDKLVCDTAAHFGKAFAIPSLPSLACSIHSMDALVEAASARFSALGWMDYQDRFDPWMVVAAMLAMMIMLPLCRRCLSVRQATDASGEDTMQELLKQNLARSLAPAQVQAWVDAMAPITGTVDDSMVRMHSKLEEVGAQILETMGVQVKNFGEKQLSEIRAQFVQLADAISDVAKVAQLRQPLSDGLESLKAQVKGSWNLDAEKIDDQFKSLMAKVNGVGSLVNSLTKKADETLQALERLGPGSLKAGIDEFAAKMSASWETMVDDKLVKSIKLLQGATQSRFQEQGIAVAELSSVGKSNIGLLREVRNVLGEYSEEHRNNLAVVKATQAVVASMAEQQAEVSEAVQKLRDMVEAQTELLQGQREALQRLSPPYRPPPLGGKGWSAPSTGVPINIDDALRSQGQPPIYYSADASAPARRENATMQRMSDLLLQVTEMLHAMRYN